MFGLPIYESYFYVDASESMEGPVQSHGAHPHLHFMKKKMWLPQTAYNILCLAVFPVQLHCSSKSREIWKFVCCQELHGVLLHVSGGVDDRVHGAGAVHHRQLREISWFCKNKCSNIGGAGSKGRRW